MHHAFITEVCLTPAKHLAVDPACLIWPRMVGGPAMEEEIIRDDPFCPLRIETELAIQDAANDARGRCDVFRRAQDLGKLVVVTGVIAPARRLIERDDQLPDFATLMRERNRAHRLLAEHEVTA